MSQALHTAAVGMKTQQQRIDTLANNIAHVNTNGFKRSRVDFQDAVYTAMQNPSLAADQQPQNLQLGQGVLVAAEKKYFSDGPLQQTERNLDLALSGSGFFALENPNGPVLYSRDGVFQTQPLAEGGYALVSLNGNYVLDPDGQRIISPLSFEQMQVSENGQISIAGYDIARIGRFTFTNPEGLEAAGSKTYLAGESSGAALAADTPVRQGFLEGSNVDLTEEMTRLIRAQRAYALLGRAVSTADQMRATENDIRR